MEKKPTEIICGFLSVKTIDFLYLRAIGLIVAPFKFDVHLAYLPSKLHFSGKYLF